MKVHAERVQHTETRLGVVERGLLSVSVSLTALHGLGGSLIGRGKDWTAEIKDFKI